MILTIWLAWIMDFILGDPSGFPHPVRIMGNYISWFDSKIRKRAKKKQQLRWAGLALAVSLLLLSYGSVWLVLKLLFLWHPLVGRIVEIGFCWTCLALHCLKKECMKIYDTLQTGNVGLARKQISYLVSRDTETLSEQGISKAAVETAAENISDGIIAPLFYLFLGGAPLAMAYKAINTMDSMVGYQNEVYQDFGFFPAKLDDLANWIPARLTGFFMVGWAFCTGKNAGDGWKILMRDHGKSKSPNAGWPESAAAGILGIQIGGPTSYFGEIVEKEYIGENKKELEIQDIKRVCNLMTGTTITMLLVGTVVYFLFVYRF